MTDRDTVRWDNYFLDVCNTVAKNSRCLSRKIGAIIVDDNRIVSTGFNGPPYKVAHCGIDRYHKDEWLKNVIVEKKIDLKKVANTCPRQLLGFKSGEGLHICIAGHGERNAIVNAASLGVRVEGLTMYMNCGIPCGDCLIEIINARLGQIVVTDTNYYDRKSEFLLEQAQKRGMFVRTYKLEAYREGQHGKEKSYG